MKSESRDSDFRLLTSMSFLEAHRIVKSYPVGGRSLTVLRDLDLIVKSQSVNRAGRCTGNVS